MCSFDVDTSLRWSSDVDMTSGLAGVTCTRVAVGSESTLFDVPFKDLVRVFQWLSSL